MNLLTVRLALTLFSLTMFNLWLLGKLVTCAKIVLYSYKIGILLSLLAKYA